MSGDVQPRKRKDKKRKKDELSIEEHRGTAAVFGEGDVLMHSQQDHGTGGHWCAKIIFFSLLAVLVTLIGLIILENRGLSELEANAVQSSYSGVLDGWIEDAPDDDHHDEHTLELRHHENIEDEDEHGPDNGHDLEDDDEDHGDEEDEHDEDDEHNDDDEPDDDEDELDEEQVNEQEVDDDDDDEDDEGNEIDHDEEGRDDDEDNEEDDDEDKQLNSNEVDDNDDDGSEEQNVHTDEASQTYNEEDDDDDDDDDDNISEGNKLDDENDSHEDAGYNNDISEEGKNYRDDDDDEENNDQSEEYNNELDHDDDENGNDEDDEDDEEHEDDHDEEPEEEIEKIEKEVTDEEEPESTEPPVPDVSVEREEETSVEVLTPDEIDEVDDGDFLEADELDEPAVERIAPPPPGKPYEEIEEAVSTEVPSNILAEEEEYEKQQELLRQQEAQSTHMWLKLAVGGALLAATHAVIRRATAPRDAPENEVEEHDSREESPVIDRRMTLIQDEAPKLAPPPSLQSEVEEEIVQKAFSSVKAAPVKKQESEEIEEDVEVDEEDQEVQESKDNKELYSDEDENEADEEVDEEEIEEKVEAPKSVPKVAASVPKAAAKKEEESEPEEVPEDVEIIEEEEVEEEVEDEEEISDVDDTELLSRLEAKYGRLPEPERPGQRHKDGGNSVEDDWPGEPSDAFWREQLDKAEQELRQGAYGACAERAGAAALAGSARALLLRARALDADADARRDNRLLARAIAAYLQLLKLPDRLSDRQLRDVALRTIDRIQFRGTYLNAEPVYRLLIRRFPNEVAYRNNLTISFLMANRADLASEVLEETLRLWPNDRVALAHYGFVLKTEQNKLEEAVKYFQKALEGDTGPANEPRFYYHLGDALLLLGRTEEAHEVHKRGAALGHFLSPSQRSLYNVPRLKSQPWWDAHRGPFAKLARELEKSWREILKEGEEARALYEKEKEGLRERGEWSQLNLFVRGQEVAGRCRRAPVTCGVVLAEPAARCRRGQVKFSLLAPGTHVRAHVGPTNCRLRMHLALSNTDNTFLRVDQETRQWQVGKVLMFDDSFEHEVWHNGTGARLVLIVDVWHPDLTPSERKSLPAI